MLPGGRGSSSGGESRFTPTLARAALAAGCNALFLEVHPEPAKAKSDKRDRRRPLPPASALE